MILINIGIDVGGRHMGLGLVGEDGEIIEKSTVVYPASGFNLTSFFATINTFLERYEEKAESIGIGIPGVVSDTFIHYTCNLPLEKIEVTDYLKTNLPIYVSNDANCATIAEYEVTDRKMFSNYIFVTVGTGIGSGMILNGNLYTGSAGSSGEIGHMVIDKDGIQCACGRRGCFEKYASLSALLKMIGTNNIEEAFYLIEKNPNLQKVFDAYLENLSEGLANVVNMFEPEMLVLGGGLAEYEKYFLTQLKTKIVSKMFNKYTLDLNLKVASLKNDAGIIGASMLYRYLI